MSINHTVKQNWKMVYKKRKESRQELSMPSEILYLFLLTGQSRFV